MRRRNFRRRFRRGAGKRFHSYRLSRGGIRL